MTRHPLRGVHLQSPSQAVFSPRPTYNNCHTAPYIVVQHRKIPDFRSTIPVVDALQYKFVHNFGVKPFIRNRHPEFSGLHLEIQGLTLERLRLNLISKWLMKSDIRKVSVEPT